MALFLLGICDTSDSRKSPNQYGGIATRGLRHHHAGQSHSCRKSPNQHGGIATSFPDWSGGFHARLLGKALISTVGLRLFWLLEAGGTLLWVSRKSPNQYGGIAT